MTVIRDLILDREQTTVDRLTYLGSWFKNNDNTVEEGALILNTRAAYARLKQSQPQTDSTLKLKGRVCCAPVCSVLSYGCEKRGSRAKDFRRSNVSHRPYLCDTVSNR